MVQTIFVFLISDSLSACCGLLFLLAEPAALLAVAALGLVSGGDVPGGLGHSVGVKVDAHFGRGVAHLIKEGMNVALDAGTTCCAIAKKLADASCRCTVITYSLPVANALVHCEHIEVFLMAGRLDKKHESFHDDVAVEAMKRMNSDVFFLSPNGIDPIAGITSSATDENIMKRMMHEHAEETIVCADHSKFFKKAFKTICQLSDIKGILSDSELSGEIQQRYSSMGVRLYLAEK